MTDDPRPPISPMSLETAMQATEWADPIPGQNAVISSSSVMRAAILDAVGAPLRIVMMSRPEPGPGEVLVRIMASGLNPLDAKIQAGAAPHAHHPPPVVLGLDMAGVVEHVGAGVTGFRSGDEVYGLIGGVGGRQGALAEYSVVNGDLLALKPANLSWRETASLPLVAITAWEGLVDRAHVQAGWKVLVHGGAGGVGRLAVQIALSAGAEVAATGSEASRQVIEVMGANFIDYGAETVAAYVARLTGGKGFNIVYDTVGGSTLNASFEAIRRFGHVVSALSWGAHALGPLSFRAGTYSGVFTLLPLLTGEGRARHGEILRDVARLVEAGRITPRIDPRHFTLDTIGEAFRALTAGASGKLVIDISADAR